MKLTSSKRVADSCSDNRKSKTCPFDRLRAGSEHCRRIQNPKWAAVLAIVFTLAMGVGAMAQAQQPKKVHRIGYLSSNDPATESTRSEAIRRALRALGHVEGQNIAIEYRYGEGKQDRFTELAVELVDRFHGTYPPNINEGTHLISMKGPTQYQVVPLVF